MTGTSATSEALMLQQLALPRVAGQLESKEEATASFVS